MNLNGIMNEMIMKPTSTLRDLILYPPPTSALSSADSKATRTEDESSNFPLTTIPTACSGHDPNAKVFLQLLEEDEGENSVRNQADTCWNKTLPKKTCGIINQTLL